jgi:hypothetical protein
VNVNQRNVRTLDDVKPALRRAGNEILFKIVRNQRTYYVVIR